MRVSILRAATALVAVVLATMLPAWAHAQLVIVERDSTLRAEPSLSAATIANVRKGTRGESLGKSGVWVNVKTPEGEGWVFTFNVRFGERSGSGGAGDIAAAGRLVSARPKTSVVSTIGIRGLSEEELQKAGFNAAEMSRLEAFAATAETSARRAQDVGLAPVSVNYLEGR